MTATGHAIIGAVIAAKIPDPFVAIPLAVVSHIAADAFPHWDTGTNLHKKSHTRLFSDTIIDIILSIFLPYLIIKTFFPGTDLVYLGIIIFAAQLLDWMSMPYVFLKLHGKPFSYPYKFQKLFDNRMDKPWGIIGQALVLIIIIAISIIS